MRQIALAGLAAAGLLSGALLGSPAARAADYGYDADDAPETVVTRRTVVERRVVLPPREIVREVVVERPAPPRRIVREVIEEPPVVYRPRPVVRDVVVEREGFYGPRRFGPRPVGYGYGPAYDPYD
ncbi:hypothetical protein ASF49_20785 [Methylobacterium sp. Leaf104]|uniref:hypothetical protein n=1 Tax=Methylobacterium TaxID=407 RepID=UPI0007021877|nr:MULTISPECIES: hypothetical protein [Methylobacterium]KQP40645.1 hypothetical protein ASF49_20785 [Methylobacterium sp. Leaf104]MCI9882775.1 hypothetical protein [Methylobacterium goesingense]